MPVAPPLCVNPSFSELTFKCHQEGKFTVEDLYLGAGCFWHSEETFRQVPGIIDTEVGWCSEDSASLISSRVEVVRVRYDPSQILLDQLIQIFWTTHDPTNHLHRQSQYLEKSVLFGRTSSQLRKLKQLLEEKRNTVPNLLTIVTDFKYYQKAPESDQHYYLKQQLKESQ